MKSPAGAGLRLGDCRENQAIAAICVDAGAAGAGTSVVVGCAGMCAPRVRRWTK